MAQNDPWNQNFQAFQTDYIAATPAKTSFGIFTKSELQALLNLPNASHIVIYSTEHPVNIYPYNRKMVAVGVDSNGNRITSPTQQYVVPIHNCPPDCDNSPFILNVNPNKF